MTSIPRKITPPFISHLFRSSWIAVALLLMAALTQPSNGLALEVTLLPKIISPTLASAQVGQLVSLQIGSTGNPTSYGATGLPAGLSINPATGSISGTPTQAGIFTIGLTASNLLGSDSAPLILTVLPSGPSVPTLTPPVITSPTIASGQVGQLLSFQVSGSSNPTSFAAVGLPAGVSIIASTGLISGVPTQAGVFTANVTAANAQGSGAAPLTITILPSATVPGITLPMITSPVAASGQVGQLLSYQIGATGNPTSFAAVGLPAGLSVNAASGLISGTPTQAGVFTASVTAANAQGSASIPLIITILPNGGETVSPAQSLPTITSPVAASGQVGQLLSYQIGASGSPTSFGASGIPSGLSINASTGLISGAPTQSGVFTASVTATNAQGSGSAPLTLTILPSATGTTPALTLPVLISPVTTSGQVGQLFTYQIVATGDPTVYAAVGLPAGVSIIASTGLISGVPTQAGVFTANVTAANVQGSGAAPLTITILPSANGAVAPVPTIASAMPPAGQIGVVYSYQISATGNPTSYGAAGLPPGLSVNPNSGLVMGSPIQAGTFNSILTATGAGGTGTSTASFTILPNAPVISSPAGVDVLLGQPFTYQIEANSNPTSYGATGLPAGLSIDAGSGLISGAATQKGVFPVTVSASNAGGTGTATITLNVTAKAATTPTINSPAGAVAQVGQPFGYLITASNEPTSFGATGLPSGLSVDPATGLISGIPTQPGNFDVALTATGATGSGAAILRLQVVDAASPSAPVITSATSGSAQVNEAFNYQITATNGPTGFGAIGLPAGLTLDANTGLISGIPTKAGNFSFVISASNSSGSALTTVSLVIAPDLPVVTISASIPSFTVGIGDVGQFELTRSGDTSKILVVTYTIRGTGSPDADYVRLKGVKKFKAGKSVVHINVVPMQQDLGGVDKKTVKVILDERPTYKLSGTPQAKVKMIAP